MLWIMYYLVPHLMSKTNTMKKQWNCCMKEVLLVCSHSLMLGMLAVLSGMLNSTVHCVSPARGIIEAQASSAWYYRSTSIYYMYCSSQMGRLTILECLHAGLNQSTIQYTMLRCLMDSKLSRKMFKVQLSRCTLHGLFGIHIGLTIFCLIALGAQVNKELMYRLITTPGNEARLASFMLQVIED